ncbi:MAG: S8 family serine peptidase [bacterium]
MKRLSVLFLFFSLAAASADAGESHLVLLRQPPDTAVGQVAWRNFINAEQAPVIAALERLRADGKVFNFRAHWLINSIRVEGTAEAFSEILALPQVAGLDTEERVPMEAIPQPPRKAERIAEATAETEYFQVKETFVYEAWEKFGLRGEGMVIGMVDSGIDPDHPDLAGKIKGFKTFNEFGEDEGLPAGDDYPTILGGSGHGTSVAGLMVGGDASGKTIGMAPEAQILVSSFNVHSTTTDGKAFPSKDALLSSYEWIADPDGNPATDDGARVIGGSYGGLQTDVYIPFVKALYQNDIVIVNAIGNSGPGAETTVSPGNIPVYVVGVGAGGAGTSQGILKLASYSSRGPVKWNTTEFRGSYAKPDITAPSGSNYTTAVGGGYTSFGGTSAATPVVAGICLLMFQAKPSLTAGEVIQIIKDTANVDDTGTSYIEIPNNNWGYGFINAYRAVSAVVEPGTVMVQIDLGAAERATVRIRGTGFVRDYAKNSVLSFQYAPGDYTLEVLADQFTANTFPFTVTAAQTITINDSITDAATDGGITVTSQSAGLVPWYLFADGKSDAVIDVKLVRKISFNDGADTCFRTVPAAGAAVAVRLESGDVTLPTEETTLDENGAAQFSIIAGTTPGKAKLKLALIDETSGAESTIESYTLNLLPQPHSPPKISDVKITPENPAVGEPVAISATITSADAASLTPLLNYSIDGGTTFATTTMIAIGGSTWIATLQGQPTDTTVKYFISVTDSFGNFTTESRGTIRDWKNNKQFKSELTYLPSDEEGEPLYNQMPLETGSTLLTDPLPDRRDIAGPLGVSHDLVNFYFLLRLKTVFEAADSYTDPRNVFVFGVPVWKEQPLEWDVAAAFLPGANALPSLNLPSIGLLTPYNSYETDRQIDIDYGEGDDLIFKVAAERVRSRMSDDSIIFSFGTLAVNTERFYTVEMDVTPLFRYYPREHYFVVPGGVRYAVLDEGWNLVSASIMTASDNLPEVVQNNDDIWGHTDSDGYVNRGDELFTFAQPKQAIWLYAVTSQAVNTPPASSSQNTTDVSVKTGWNFFANPYTSNLVWDDLITVTDTDTGTTKTISEAASSGADWLVNAVYYYYQGGYHRLADGDTLQPARGYAVYVRKPLTLHLPKPQ